MTLEKKVAKLFNLNEQNWEKHSNPWSVYTRYSVLPLIAASFWSRELIGDLHYVPAVASFAWMFFNPILFDKPKSTNNWASKSVIGERIYANRDEIDIPKHHDTKLIPLLNTISGAGLALSIYGMVELDLVSTVVGIGAAYLGKSWYLDRMNWLCEDMKEHKEYENMLY